MVARYPLTGEFIMNATEDGALHRRRTVRITYADGNTCDTWINGTMQSIREYYIGNFFNFGDTDFGVPDNMQEAVSVEFLED
jgi:hypothetical protein